MIGLINGFLLAVTVFVLYNLLKVYRESQTSLAQTANKVRLMFTGFIANIADTLGIGSFAVIVALDKSWNLLDDKRLPGTLNCQSILPSLLQSILFLKFIELDLTMLIVFVIAGCIGGFTGGFLVSRLNKQSIRIGMCLGFLGIGFLILANQLQLLPLAGESTSLQGTQLLLGFVAMFLVGMFPSIGVGFYAPTQVVLFLLGLSPLVAFPVMSTVGVIVQSSTALAFISKREISVRESILLTLVGVAGVIVSVPFITYVNLSTLRWLLFMIVIYNSFAMWKSWSKGRKQLLAPVVN